jgi:E3 ubiquitin-protein ligase DOA10
MKIQVEPIVTPVTCCVIPRCACLAILVDIIGTVMFLHWLAGMIFIFYLASFVMLLREVLRPGVLWFLRNLNDQNFHPINEVSDM